MVIHEIDNNSTDIRNDIRSLEDSVSSRSGTVSDWNTEVVAIRERIGRLWDDRKENELKNELECVVDRIRNIEQRGIKHTVCHELVKDGNHNS